MSRSLRSVLVLLVALGLLALPAGADEHGPCEDPETGELVLDELQTYLHGAETQAGNLGAIGATGFPSWSEDAPAASVTEGAGAGYLTNSSNFVVEEDETVFGLTLEGEFSGCLDTMLFDLYAFLPTNRTGTSGNLEESPFTGIINVHVNGQQVVFGSEIDTVTEPNPDGDATYLVRLSVTNLHNALARLGVDPTGDHELRINVSPRYINTDNALFVYDTTEVPAGILFNGTPDLDYPAVPAF